VDHSWKGAARFAGRFGLAGDWTRWAVLLLAAAAFALRLYHLDYQSIWGDEHYSIVLSAASVGDILRVGMLEEPHPPLYNLLLHFWGLATGNGVFAIRFFSLVAGVASIPIIYALGRRMSSPVTGFLAALLMAVNPYQVAHSQDARMYALVTGLVPLANLALLHAMAAPRPRTWALFVIAIVAATYVHHYAAFALVACNFYFLVVTWWPPLRARVGETSGSSTTAGALQAHLATRAWLAAQAAILVLCIPWFFSLIALSGRAGYEPSVTLPGMFQQLTILFSGGGFLGESGGVVVGSAAAALVILGLVEYGRRFPRTDAVPLLLTVLATLVPILVVYVLQEALKKQSFHERYLMFLSPFFYLAIAAGLGAVRRLRWLAATLLVALVLLASGVGLSNHYFDARYANGDYKGIAAYLQEHGRPRDAIALSGEAVNRLFRYYYRGQLPVLALDPGDDVPARLKSWSSDYDRIWFMPYWQTELDSRMETWLAANLYPARTDWFANARLNLYGVAGDPRLSASGVRFGESLELESYGLASTARAGDVAPLMLNWRTNRRLDDGLKVSLRLTDRQGRLYWQADAQPRQGLLPTSHWMPDTLLPDRYGLPIPPGTPPGIYLLQLRVYGAAGELPVAGAAGISASAGSGLALGEIRVTRGVSTAGSEITPGQLVTAPAVDGIALLGMDLDAGPWRSGSSVALGLYWQATGTKSPGGNRGATLRLVGKGDEVLAQRHQPLLSADYPTSDWQPGEVVRAIWDLAIPAAAAAGESRLQVRLDGAAAWATLATVQVEARPRVLRAPVVGNPRAITAGPGLLVGYDLPSDPVRPGSTLELTLHWKAIATAERSFKVFAHVLNREGVLVAQQDSEPCQGACPTDSWVAGEYLRDVYSIVLPAGLAPGGYQLEIGMYDPARVRRLPVLDESGSPLPDDRLLLRGFRVEGK
jgi:4-amino-4-deoxy-L-arabinose transferase-like glycosyltransferase